MLYIKQFWALVSVIFSDPKRPDDASLPTEPAPALSTIDGLSWKLGAVDQVYISVMYKLSLLDMCIYIYIYISMLYISVYISVYIVVWKLGADI